jgi:hypothetical protein
MRYGREVMRIILSFIVLSVIFTFNAFCNETAVKPVFDERDWKLSSTKTSPEGNVTSEYILSNEQKENWTEAVTLQFLKGANKYIDLNIYESSSKVRLSSVCPGIAWESLYEDEADRMWTWSITGCKGQKDLSEIARAVMSDDGIHIWRYSIRQSPVPLLNKRIWMDNLKSFKLG